jgi:2-alkyl-3-oxoalkanoate reductase
VTVLVTGAAGFLGRHVTELLQSLGERPRALVHPEDNAELLERVGVDVYRGDVADCAVLRLAVEGVDRVLHCAARTGPWGPPEAYQRTNVRALETLVRTALTAGVKRIVHVSSVTVHGNDLGGAGDESSPLREEPNPYSRSKVAGERLLMRMIAEERAPVTVVRPGWIYGPGDRASFARLAHRIEQQKMLIIGSGANHVPLIYVRDVARGILLASEAPEAEGRSYVLVNDEPVTQRDFMSAIAEALGAPTPTRRIPYALAISLGAAAERLARLVRSRTPPPVMRYGMQMLGGENRFSIARARAELGFAPLVDLAEGVRRSVDWYRSADSLAELAPAKTGARASSREPSAIASSAVRPATKTN